MTATDPATAQPATPGLDLDAIQARADAASDGPWRDHDTHLDVGGHTATVLRGGLPAAQLVAWLPTMSHEPWNDARNCWADAAFIAAARADVPALVAEVRRLRAELDAAPAPEPGLPLRIAAAKLARGAVWADPFGQWNAEQAQAAGAQKQLMVDRLNDLAGELDAAPAAPRTYQLPAEPAEGAQLCDTRGVWWVRDRNLWHEVTEVNPPMVRFWWQLVAAGPLSTVPPAGAAAQ